VIRSRIAAQEFSGHFPQANAFEPAVTRLQQGCRLPRGATPDAITDLPIRLNRYSRASELKVCHIE
jgi:hypothetical protein